MTAQRSCLFPLNNSNLLWKSNPKHHLHWLKLVNVCSEKHTIWIFHTPIYKYTPPPINRGDILKVSDLEEQIANEYHAARNAHFKMLSWVCCKSGETQFFMSVFDTSETGLHDQCARSNIGHQCWQPEWHIYSNIPSRNAVTHRSNSPVFAIKVRYGRTL